MGSLPIKCMQEGKKELKNFQNLLPHVDHKFFQLMIEKSSQAKLSKTSWFMPSLFGFPSKLIL